MHWRLHTRCGKLSEHLSSSEVEPSMRSAFMLSPFGSTLDAKYACRHWTTTN